LEPEERGRKHRDLMWILKVSSEGLPEKSFRILPGNVRTLGRSTGADFIVDAALVSRVHCRLSALLDGGLEVSDLESTNGTFVNGERVDRARLNSGDRVQMGRLELVATREEA
jgi:pSer/pThr/pTyr-binding forkhead associated (FHA) protein